MYNSAFKVGGSAISTAVTGASIGTAINPGGGTLIGAGIGLLVGTVGGLFGLGASSGGGGSGKSIGKKTKSALKYEDKQNLKKIKRDEALAIQAIEKATRLYNDLRDQKYDEELANYELAIEQRETNFNAAQKLYKESVRAFDEAVDLNNISASMAMNDARRAYNDKRTDLNNRGQLLALQLASGRRNRKLNEDIISRQMFSSIKEAKLNARGVNTRLRQARVSGANAIKEATRSFEYATASAQKDIEINNLQLEGQKNLLKAEMKTLLGEKNALINTANLKKQDVLNSVDNAKAEADFAQQTLALQQDERYAEAAIQTDQLRRQGLLEQSAQIAKGQAGRSAAKAVQGMAFSNQQAQKIIAAAIIRADSKHTIDKTKIAQSLYHFQQQGQSELKSTAIGLKKAVKEFGAAKFRMASRKSELGILKKQATKVQQKLAYDKRTTMNSMRDTRQKFANAITNSNIDLARLSNSVNLTQHEFHNKLIKNDLQQYNLAAQTKLSFESLAYAGDSLRSQLRLNNERIKFDKYLANRAASSQVLDPPKLPEHLPPPVKAPDLVIQPNPEIDYKGIEKQMKKNRKAKRATIIDPGQFSGFLNNIQGIADQAAKLAGAFKAPPQVQTPQQMVGAANLDYGQVSEYLNNNVIDFNQQMDTGFTPDLVSDLSSMPYATDTYTGYDAPLP